MLKNPALRFFLSSTTKDLSQIRDSLATDIRTAGHIPLGMEWWPAMDMLSLEAINEAIGACDVYVGIVGGRYGSTLQDPNDSNAIISYTQYEFRLAVELKKYILIFVMEESDYKVYRNKQLDNDPDRRFDQELNNFRQEVQRDDLFGTRLVRFFPFDPETNPDFSKTTGSITRDILGGLYQLETRLAGKGLVPSDSELLASGHMRSNPILMDILATFQKYELISSRCGENKPLKEGMARYFWDHFFAALRQNHVDRIFFESGSSVLYVAHELWKRLLSDEDYYNFKEDCLIRSNIATNNILIYLDFVLNSNIRIDLWPHGKPDDRYGATFGAIPRLPKPNAGDPPPDLEMQAKIINRMIKEFRSRGQEFDDSHVKEILLLGVSGVYFGDRHPNAGLHVGDYVNTVFKRMLFKIEYPIICFIDESKLSIEFNPNRYYMCGEDMLWKDIVDKTPIAFCIGTSSEIQRKKTYRLLESSGFNFVVAAGLSSIH